MESASRRRVERNNNTGLAAGILLAVIPIVIAYIAHIFLQRWIVGGPTAGAPRTER